MKNVFLGQEIHGERNVNGFSFYDSIKLYLVEPNIFIMPNCFEYDNDIELVNLEFAVNSSDIVVLLVDHNEFNQIDLDLLSDKYVIDTRGIWS